MTTGKPLQLHLQACDVKSKEEKSGPESMLIESSTGDGRWPFNHFKNNIDKILHFDARTYF